MLNWLNEEHALARDLVRARRGRFRADDFFCLVPSMNVHFVNSYLFDTSSERNLGQLMALSFGHSHSDFVHFRYPSYLVLFLQSCDGPLHDESTACCLMSTLARV